jgi:hypothetical protein
MPKTEKTLGFITLVLFLLVGLVLLSLDAVTASQQGTDSGKLEVPHWALPGECSFMPIVTCSAGFTCQIGLHFYLNPSLSVSGLNLNKDDEVCTDDTIDLNNAEITGEFLDFGGPHDSPPIQFTENLSGVISEIDTESFHPKTYFTLDGTNSAFICSKNCRITESEGLEKINKKYKVVKEGEVNFQMLCEPECIQFSDTYQPPLPPVYGYANGINLLYSEGELCQRTKMTELRSSFSLTARKSHTGPIIEATLHLPETPQNSRPIVRSELENKGDMKAYIGSVRINAKHKILYKPDALKPGESSEILAQLETEGNAELKMEISFSPEKLGCLKTKDFSLQVDLGSFYVAAESCSADSDCSIGETCCTGTCRPSSKGVCDDIDGDGEPDTWVGV